MASVSFDAKGDLVVTPSSVSSQDDFDFLTGSWNIHNRKLKTRLNNCQEWDEFKANGTMHKVLHGMGNADNFITTFDGKSFEGVSIRMFNPKTKLWSIYWADTNTGALDKPVTGSFENNIGRFFCRDVFNGKEILVTFQWDKTDPEKPVWSQAFSADNGKTWEWNWSMTFTRKNYNVADLTQPVNVLELRNYLLNPATTDKFIRYFNDHFVDSQNALQGHVLGTFTVEDHDDRFFWMRGFNNMAVRGDFLRAFYDGPIWKGYGKDANKMMIDSDQVHLLRPLQSSPADKSNVDALNSNAKKFIVIDYYFAKDGQLENLINLFKREYLPALQQQALHPSLWVTEMSENNYPRLPVIQDKNLLVAILSFSDEAEYRLKSKLAEHAHKQFEKIIQEYTRQKETVILHRALNY
jgi:hypothetical protein